MMGSGRSMEKGIRIEAEGPRLEPSPDKSDAMPD